MVLPVIVLAGAINSGKSKTLRGIAAKGHGMGGNVFSIKGKRICIYFSSLQERVGFCIYHKAIKLLEHMIWKCKSEKCALLIIAFRMKAKRGQLNSNCVTKPLAHLARKGLKAHLVYLRKASGRKSQLNLMDDLMSRLKAQEINSRRGDQKRQAAELWKIVRTVDP
ncbi:MAG: hypothetical protein ABSG74_12100 [Candidatus Bathyarchaeia archaeon]|jgi:hypothetical protein